MYQFLENYKSELEKVLKHLREELTSFRTGRANPALVENLLVEVYGTRMPLKQLASISTPDPKTIFMQIWDKSLILEIEKAIAISNLGLTPSVEGTSVYLRISALTEEKRKELVKTLHQRLEQARIAIRGSRDKIREKIIKGEREKEITEDEKYQLFKKLDEITTEFNEQIKKIGEKKEEEIMTV